MADGDLTDEQKAEKAAAEKAAADKIKADALKSPEVQALIQAAVEEAVTGLKATNAALKDEKTTALAKAKEFEGLDATEIKALLERIGQDEEAKLISEGKISEVLEKRTERLRADYDGQLKAKDVEIEALKKQVETQTKELSSLKLDDAVNAAATKIGVLAEASEDALARAKRIFALNDKGLIEGRDASGALILSKDGSSPLTVPEWLEGMKDSAPHWWAATKGADAAGGAGHKSGDKNPWLPEHRNVTERMKIAKADPELAKRLQAEAKAPAQA